MSDKMTIKTNHQPRDVIYWYELTNNEKKDFDYHETEDSQQEARFFRYKGCVYDLNEFTRVGRAIAPHPQRPGWDRYDGYLSDSFFSGVLIHYVDDFKRVIVATYFC